MLSILIKKSYSTILLSNSGNFKNGFTLVEILLVISLITLIAIVSVPVTQSALFQNNLILTANSIVNSARTAQLKSRSQQNDSVWGVSIQSNSIIIFQGTSYSARVVSSDSVSQKSPGVVVTGVTEFTFSKMLAEPSATGDIILTSASNQKKTLTLNSKGIINY